MSRELTRCTLFGCKYQARKRSLLVKHLRSVHRLDSVTARESADEMIEKGWV